MASYAGSTSRMQQEAMAGIREMQNRMREREGSHHFRNWSTEPNIPRSDRTPRRVEPPPEPMPAAPPHRTPEPLSYPQAGYGYEPGYSAEPPHYRQTGYGQGYPQGHGAQFPGYGQGYPQNGETHHTGQYGRSQQPRRGGFLSNLFGGGNQRNTQQNRNQGASQQPRPDYERQAPPPPPSKTEPSEEKKTTLLQDILNGVGLDDDRILILGLILILVNDKADTTLILALLYLLL